MIHKDVEYEEGEHDHAVIEGVNEDPVLLEQYDVVSIHLVWIHLRDEKECSLLSYFKFKKPNSGTNK